MSSLEEAACLRMTRQRVLRTRRQYARRAGCRASMGARARSGGGRGGRGRAGSRAGRAACAGGGVPAQGGARAQARRGHRLRAAAERAGPAGAGRAEQAARGRAACTGAPVCLVRGWRLQLHTLATQRTSQGARVQLFLHASRRRQLAWQAGGKSRACSDVLPWVAGQEAKEASRKARAAARAPAAPAPSAAPAPAAAQAAPVPVAAAPAPAGVVRGVIRSSGRWGGPRPPPLQ